MATIGSSTAPSQNTINYDALLSLSLEYIRDTLVDNIFTSAPFLGALYGAFGKKRKTKKGVRMVNGGDLHGYQYQRHGTTGGVLSVCPRQYQ